TIVLPAAAAQVNSVPTISGTTADDAGGSGVNLIDIEISSGSGTRSYWNSSTSQWVSNVQHWNPVTVAAPWTYSTAGLGLLPDKDYYIRIRVTDAAQNFFITQTSTFTYDTQPPTISLSTPTANATYSTVIVSTPFG